MKEDLKMSTHEDLKRLKYLLEICLDDYKTINSIVDNGLDPYSIRSNEKIATNRINGFYLLHRDNFNELLKELSNINLDNSLFEEHIKESLNKLK